MADTPEMYRSRAEAEHKAAAAATLDNVRERCERAGRAWDAMADRAERTARLRAAREHREGLDTASVPAMSAAE